MNSSTDKTIKDQDQDMAGAGAALKRAARQARIIAAQTHTPLVIYKNGHIEKRMIEKEMPEDGK
ncbi:MAG: hypothetical protein Q9M24_08435 [Mariprofundaceae bacterium]|nr:hypothetical protein [Mariprofundaceae bacterium]